MNITAIKTRLGLILQGLVGVALHQAGYSFRENWQYDPDCECPDFTIPDGDKPDIVVEVHQTDSRDSFRMKILRTFTAVSEAKAYLSQEILTVNILFGNPRIEIPEGNFTSICSFFDVNIIPCEHETLGSNIMALEKEALLFAQNGDLEIRECVDKLKDLYPGTVDELSAVIVDSLRNAQRNHKLDTLWRSEIERRKKLGKAPAVGEDSYFKRSLLHSLFLSDGQFDELLKLKNLKRCSADLHKQLVKVGLGESQKAIGGETIILESEFGKFIKSKGARELRELCSLRILSEPAMYWFFEDIRNEGRRNQMATIFLSEIEKGEENLSRTLCNLLSSPN